VTPLLRSACVFQFRWLKLNLCSLGHIFVANCSEKFVVDPNLLPSNLTFSFPFPSSPVIPFYFLMVVRDYDYGTVLEFKDAHR